MAVLPHEGTYAVMYGSLAVAVGSAYRPGYLARPDRAGTFPTVLAVPGLDGLGAHEKDLARRLARRGLAVLVVDPVPQHPSGDDFARYAALSDSEAIRVLDEAYEYLCSDDIDWSATERVGVLGLDVGGRFALIQCAHRSWVGAAAVVSTPLTGDEDRRFPVADVLEHLPAPVLGLYGTRDDLIAVETVDEAQRRNASGNWLLYDGAGHTFMDDSGPGYHPASAEDAIQRLAGFFLDSLPEAEKPDLG